MGKEVPRHIDCSAGKADTEAWLHKEGIPFTSFRPTYIYGPGNYNPVERWFFDRIVHNRPIPLPGDGSTITQLGHVEDLADAHAKALDHLLGPLASWQKKGSKTYAVVNRPDMVATALRKAGAQVQAVQYQRFVILEATW